MNRLPIHWARGLNLLAEPRLIEDDEYAWGENLVLDVDGSLRLRDTIHSAGRKRLPFGAELDSEYATEAVNYVKGISFNSSVLSSVPSSDALSSKAIMLVYEALTAAPMGAGEFYSLRVSTYDGAAPSEVLRFDLPPVRTILDKAGEMWEMPGGLFRPTWVMQDRAIVIPDIAWVGGRNMVSPPPQDSDAALGIIRVNANGVYNATTHLFEGTGNAKLRARLIGLYRNRCVYANLYLTDASLRRHDYIVFSDPGGPANIGDNAASANGRNIRIGDIQEGSFTGLVEVQQTSVGSPSTSALLVLKERAAYLITGEPGLISDTSNLLGDMQVQRMSQDVGCVNPDVICRTPFGIIWADTNDVWAFPHGQVPFRIGDKIRPALEQAAATYKYAWHATYFQNKYRLSIVYETPERPWPYFRYPPADQTFELDLTHGFPQSGKDARWAGPLKFNLPTQASYSGIVAGERGLPFPLGGDFSVETSSLSVPYPDGGPAFRLGDLRSGENGFDEVTVNAFTQTAEPVEFEFRSKQFAFSDPMTQKQALGVEVDIKPANDVTMRFDWLPKNTDVTKQAVKMFPASANDQFAAVQVHAPSSRTLLGRSLQLKVTREDTPIPPFRVPEPRTVAFAYTVANYGSPQQTFMATLPDRTYETVNELRAQVLASLNEASNGVSPFYERLYVGGPGNTEWFSYSGDTFYLPVNAVASIADQYNGGVTIEYTAEMAAACRFVWDAIGANPSIYEPANEDAFFVAGASRLIRGPASFEFGAMMLQYVPFNRLP